MKKQDQMVLLPKNSNGKSNDGNAKYAKWMTDYDETQNIGKRYRRQDELGTPYCVTIDFETIDDKAVTIRDRDTMQQDRIAIDQLVTYLGDRLT